MASTWQVLGEAQRFRLRGFTVHRLALQPGPLVIQLDAHLLTFIPAHGECRGTAGPPAAIDVLPAGARLDLEASEPSRLDAIEVPKAFVRRGGPDSGALPALQCWADPVAYQAGALMVAAACDPDDATKRSVPAEQLMRVVVTRILQHAALPLRAKVGDGRLDADRLARVQDFIVENLHRRITAEDLAAVAALHSNHFARTLMRSVGASPAKYVLQQRVRHAQSLMVANLQQPLSAIAADAGFASQSHMCDVFQRYVGMSPSAYRAAILGATAGSEGPT